MTKQNIILIASRSVVITGLVCWLLPISPIAMAQSQQAETPSPIPDTYPQLSLKNMSRDAAIHFYVLRLVADHDYDGKVSLNFYAKVVDENNKPVPDAKIHLSWNTVDDPSGTKEKDVTSDVNGFFSLTGQRGKDLGVRVEKDGYYTVDRGGAELNFEYADPSSPDYYEPDPKNPVVFHLRKMGPGAKLFSKELLLHAKGYQLDARVNLMAGFVGPEGVLHLTMDATKFLPGAQAFPWSAAVAMGEGGMIETKEQFPFEAPASGYNTKSATMDMSNLDRKTWSGWWVKTYYFYLPSTNIYGRMTITFSVNLGVTVQYFYNPTPGDRYLEPAPK